MENYIVHSDGSIWSNISNKFLKPSKHPKGYLKVILDKKCYSVHRLVAEKYIPNPNNLPEVNHKNNIKSDNRIENLEWVTGRQNVKHRFNKEYPNITLTKNNTYRVYIYLNKKLNYLGTYKTIEDANKVCLEFKEKNNILD